MRRVSVAAESLAARRVIFREPYHCSACPTYHDPLGRPGPVASHGCSTLWVSRSRMLNAMVDGWPPGSPMGLEGSGLRFWITGNGSKAEVIVVGRPGS